MIMKTLLVYAVMMVTFLALDGLWLGIVARDFYRQQLSQAIQMQVNWWAALSFYVLNVAGLLFFVVRPASQGGSVLMALGTGALFGLFTYAAYDLTNLATVRNWPLVMSAVDMVWGICLNATVAAVGTFAACHLRH